MTDTEVIATWMEPRPILAQIESEDLGRRRLVTQRFIESEWWGWSEGDCAWQPRHFTLDALHEVEARLTDKQWCAGEGGYLYYLSPILPDEPPYHRQTLGWLRSVLHVSAGQKIAALAAVLRPLVEPKEATHAR